MWHILEWRNQLSEQDPDNANEGDRAGALLAILGRNEKKSEA